MKTWWTPGDWNAICDQCGRRFKSSQLRKRWDGYMVCADDWETRHPQEFVRPVKDNHPLPWTRPNKDINADGTPVSSVAPAFNCAGAVERQYDPLFPVTLTMAKGHSIGPVIIEDGVTVTVLCSWTID